MSAKPEMVTESRLSKAVYGAALAACGIAGFVLAQYRDGWAEHIAWFAISMSAGGFYALYFWPKRR